MIFRGKRVALIGPAPIKNNVSDLVKSCDIVVRINQALPISKEVKRRTTDRCDVLYVWRKIRPNSEWEKLIQVRVKTDALFSPDFIDTKRFRMYESIKVRVALIDPAHFYGLSQKLGCRANTGMCAISEIAEDEPALLYIDGITFYQRGIAYHKGYVSEALNAKVTRTRGNIAQHKQHPQLAYFKQYIYPLSFVQCSEELDDIVKCFTL